MQSVLTREGKIDVRRDEEQNVRLGELLKLLIDAGYYRARIKGLSPFDKIIGGMTWCIEVCSFDVDIDLLFHDSLTIGQKISLTERIVNVLPRMKCPHRIEPHQIQGLDAIHILPVIQWLVKLAVATRNEYQDETKDTALNEYERYYGKVDKGQDAILIEKLRNIKLKYGPKRRFIAKENILDQHEKTLSTLFEYSISSQMPQIAVESDSDSEEEQDKELQALVGEKMIFNEMSDILFSEESTAKTRQELSMLGLEGFLSLEETIRLKNCEIQNLNTDMTLKKKLIESEHEKLESLVENVKRKKENIKILQKEIRQCQKLYSTEDAKKIEQLSFLLEDHEMAKLRATTFKEKCTEEAENIRLKISKLRDEVAKPDTTPDAALLELHATEAEKLQTFRSKFGEKTRKVEILKRLIDDVPGTSEVSQYQKRFVELYKLVRAAQHETQQFYNMYNTLSDSQVHMEKESTILNSVLDKMEEGLTTSSRLEDYLRQLDSIIDGIKQKKAQLEKKRAEFKEEKTDLSRELNRLQESQMLYARFVHQFSQEAAKNEILYAKLEG